MKLSIDKNELRWVLLWGLLVAVLSSLPYLYGLWMTPEGYSFVGLTHNIDDGAVYLSWTRQAADGHLFIRNLFTNEPQAGKQINVLFLAMGMVTRVSHLPCIAVFHLFRIGFAIALMLAVWRFTGLFLDDRKARMAAIPIAALSSGIGWLMPNAQMPNGSVDAWQPEAITFLSIYLNPLFLAGLLLMVGAFYYLILTERTGKTKYAMFAGIHVLVLANVHSYDVITVAAVWAAYILVRIGLSRAVPLRTIWLSLLAAAISMPAIAYQVYNYRIDPIYYARANTAISSPPLGSFITGYGLVLAVAIGGAVVLWRRGTAIDKDSPLKPQWLLLVVWSIVGFAVPYLPIAQQRKLIMGIHLPLCILAGAAAAYAFQRLKPVYACSLLAVGLILASVTNWQFLSMDTQLLARGETVVKPYLAYLSNNEIRTMDYIRSNARPGDAVLASPQMSLFLPGYAGAAVCYGHWSETPDLGQKLAEWVAVLDVTRPSPERRSALLDSRCSFVVIDRAHPEEREFQVGDLPLKPMATFGEIAIYQVTR